MKKQEVYRIIKNVLCFISSHSHDYYLKNFSLQSRYKNHTRNNLRILLRRSLGMSVAKGIEDKDLCLLEYKAETATVACLVSIHTF